MIFISESQTLVNGNKVSEMRDEEFSSVRC